MAVVNGLAMWADVFEPNYYEEDKPKWQVKLVVDEPTAEKLTKEGLLVNVKNPDREPQKIHGKVIPDVWKPGRQLEEGDYLVINFKRNVDKKKGKKVVGKNPPPKVVDAKRNSFHLEIGNGSEINVQYGLFNFDNKFGKGVSSDLMAIQVVKYVPPPNDAGGEFEDEEGFDANSEDFADVPSAGGSDDDVPF